MTQKFRCRFAVLRAAARVIQSQAKLSFRSFVVKTKAGEIVENVCVRILVQVAIESKPTPDQIDNRG